MHPLLNPSVATVWRDDCTLQIGVDAEDALVLTAVDRRRAAFLARLDGTRSYPASVAAGELLGLSRAEAETVLSLLAGAGLLVDAAARPPTTRPPDDRDRLAADAASWSLDPAGAEPGGAPGPPAGAGAAVLDRRRRAVVVVEGHGALRPELARQLSRAWLGRVVEGAVDAAGPRPDLVVLCTESPLPAAGRAESLLGADVPHLVCATYERVAVVGPLVLPGRSPCLTCLELHRTDRDPGWPTVAAQLARPARTLTGLRRQPACDGALAGLAAAATTAAVLALVDAPDAPHELAGGLVEHRRPSVVGRRRSWGRHPYCGCHWSDR